MLHDPFRRAPSPGPGGHGLRDGMRRAGRGAVDPLSISVEDPRRARLDALLGTAEGVAIGHEPRVLDALASAYRLRGEVLVARRGETVEGALPLLRIRGPLGA